MWSSSSSNCRDSEARPRWVCCSPHSSRISGLPRRRAFAARVAGRPFAARVAGASDRSACCGASVRCACHRGERLLHVSQGQRSQRVLRSEHSLHVSRSERLPHVSPGQHTQRVLQSEHSLHVSPGQRTQRVPPARALLRVSPGRGLRAPASLFGDTRHRATQCSGDQPAVQAGERGTRTTGPQPYSAVTGLVTGAPGRPMARTSSAFQLSRSTGSLSRASRSRLVRSDVPGRKIAATSPTTAIAAEIRKMWPVASP